MDHGMEWFCCALGGVVFLTLGVWAGQQGMQRRFECVAGSVGSIIVVFKYFWLGSHWQESGIYLPLHLCNLTEMTACLALLATWRWPKTLLYFWSLGAVAAFLFPQPPIELGMVAYLMFWVSHAFILYAVVYELVVADYRPRWRDFLFAVSAWLLYLACVIPLDILMHQDYGFVGPSRAGVDSPVEFFGPWPQRLVWMVLLSVLAFLLVWLPWELIPRRWSSPTPVEYSDRTESHEERPAPTDG